MAELGLSFGNVAETYRRVRPPYSRPLLDLSQEALEFDAGAHVLDLGAGTGRFAAQRKPPWDDRFTDSPFESLRFERHEERMVVEPHELLELYSTTSSLAAISCEEREQLFAAVRPLLAGPYSLPLKHELTWTRLA